MKKKMLFMAAIAGLVSLGSCVKDDVSASVEAVRNAKANALNAEANRDNATAEHTRAISAALVAVQQATARNTEALAKAQELLNQVKAAALDAEIAKQIAQYEKDLAQAKAQLQDELNNLEQSVRNAALAKYTDVSTAIGDYNFALIVFTQAQKDVIAAKLRLAAAKNDAEHATEIKANAIKTLEKEIKDQEALIAKLKEVESEGVDVAEARAEIAKLRAEIVNAMYEFEKSEEAVGLANAGLALGAAKQAFNNANANSYTKVNSMVADALGSWIGSYYVGGVLQPLTWLPAGFQYDSNGDDIIDAVVPVPWGGTYTGYYQTVGTAAEYKASDLVKFALGGFSANTGYRYEYTLDNYDEHGCLVGSTCEITGKPAVADGVNDDAPALTSDASQYSGIVNGFTSFSVNEYRVNELTKNAADAYFKDYPTNAKNALTKAQNELALLKAKLGTSSDAKDAKYKDANGDEHLTDYANKKIADEDYDKAKKAVETAQANVTGKPEAVKKAYDALLAEVQKKSFDGDKWIAAVVTLAEAVEQAYGTPAYDPNLKKYTWPANQNAAVEYLFGVAGKTKANLDDEAEVKELFDDTKAGKIVKSWATGTAAADKTADHIDKVREAINRSTAKDAKKSVFVELEDAKTNRTAAKAAAEAAAETINGTYNAEHQLIVKGTNQLIAEKNDEIAKRQLDVENANAVKAKYEAAIKATDLDAYNEAAKALKEAVDAYNTAATAYYMAHYMNIDQKQNEINALQVVIKQQDIESQILAAEKRIADAKNKIANWENIETTPGAGDFDNNAEAIIAQAEADLVDAIAALASATADLKAAEAQLEAIVGDLDIEYDLDDEPAEEPETPEEPTDTPSEGGEETPAEGEGEAEGGEEA